MFREEIKIVGQVKVTMHNIVTGEDEIHIFKNLVTTMGLNKICALVMGESTVSFNYIGVGSSTQAPAMGNTDLVTAIGSRKLCTSRTRAQNIATFSTFYDTTDNNGTWAECILADATSGGNILSRALFTYVLTKDSNKTATLEWSVSIL